MLQSVILLLMPLAGLAAAVVPPAPQMPGSRFSLPVAPKLEAKRDFDRDLAAAYRKWGKSVPEGHPSMFSLYDEDGRVNVDPLGSDDTYIADVEVGTPPQRLRIALDTGSADLWIQSTDTVYTRNKKGPYAPQYNPGVSETSRLVEGANWSVSYLDGTRARGIVYRDTVRLGGFTVEDTPIESAQTVAPSFETETLLSGLMGLAKRLGSTIEPIMPSFLTMLKPLLDQPVFTVDVRKNATGRYDFGYINESLGMESLTWVDSDPDSPHWDIRLELTTWDGPNASWYYQPFMATIDTGTTLMLLPDNIASMYWMVIPGVKKRTYDDRYTFPCGEGPFLPNLFIKVPGSERVMRIPGPYLNYGPVEGEPGYCWGGMQSAEGMEVTVLGDIMLKALFVAFDLEKNRIGFANKVLEGIDY